MNSFGNFEQKLKNVKLILEYLKLNNFEINGTNWNESRYQINKNSLFIPTWFEYVSQFKNKIK